MKQLATGLPDMRQSDDWTPQPWDQSIAARARNASLLGPQLSQEPPRGRQSLARVRKDALPVAAPFLITGGIAFVFSVLINLPAIAGVSLSLLLLILVAVVGYFIANGRNSAFVTAAWLTVLVNLCVQLPLNVIQVTLLREPFVSIQYSSALPAILATAVTLMAIVTIGAGCAVAAFDAPENAALLFLPGALLVNAVLGAPAGFGVASAVGILSFVYLLAGAAMVIGMALRPALRLLVPPVTFGLEMLLLLVMSRGPVTDITSGGIVKFLYLLTMAIVIAMLVVVPVIAAWLRRTRASRAMER